MLRAHAQGVADVDHVTVHVTPADKRAPRGNRNHSREHANRGRLDKIQTNKQKQAKIEIFRKFLGREGDAATVTFLTRNCFRRNVNSLSSEKIVQK